MPGSVLPRRWLLARENLANRSILKVEFYVTRLIRAHPVTVESIGHASLELNQRRRARLDIGRVEHREIAAVLPRTPDHRQQPTLAFFSIVAALNKHRLGDGIACRQQILAATRTAAIDVNQTGQRAKQW